MSKPFDKIITIDFETRWSKKDYTLSKLTTEEYIRDKRFKAFGACVHEFGTDNPIEWVGGDGLREYFSGIDWGRTAVLAHNAQFDVSILSWRYGARPAFIFDTLSMARALRGVEVGNSLARLAEDFGLPPKGTAVYSTDGMAELDEHVESELADYCKHDVYLCESIFGKLRTGFPTKELKLIDLTLKMYTRPMLELDKNMLAQAIIEEKTNREDLLQRLGVEEAALASNEKFAQILEGLGVEPPTKISKTTGKETLALAKNDALFQALLNSEREDIALLCEARLRVKSTSERTRAQRFLDIAHRGRLPVPLSYYGAATGRWTASKGSAINMQNLKRGSFLRKAIMAPEGHVIVAGDLSQIEPRILAHLSQDPRLLAVFAKGDDIHMATAMEIFGLPSNQITRDMRRAAKTVVFGIVYGISPFGLSQNIGVSQAEAKKYIDTFFEKFAAVRALMDQNIAEGKEKGYTTTILGRRRPIPELQSGDPAQRGFGDLAREGRFLRRPVPEGRAEAMDGGVLDVHSMQLLLKDWRRKLTLAPPAGEDELAGPELLDHV